MGAMHRPPTTLAVPAVALALALATTACSAGASRSAEALIEIDLAGQIGLGDLDAVCQRPDDPEVGTVFTCTATTEAGDEITFEAEFTSEDEVFVYPTNVIGADDMPVLEQITAAQLTDQLGDRIEPGDVDCPDTSVVLDAGFQMQCELAVAESGERFPVTLSFSGFVPREGFGQVVAELVDTPIEN